MFEVRIQPNYPHGQSSKIVKNGKKRDGTQKLLCRCCRKQFQFAYKYKSAEPAIKALIPRLWERNGGIRDIGGILQVSRRCVLNQLSPASPKRRRTICSAALNLMFSYRYKHNARRHTL